MIGIYVHHAGSGHRTRAHQIAAALRRAEQPVVLVGSNLAGSGVDDGVDLPLDHDGPHGDYRDPTAGQRLHWAPLRHPGLTERMGLIAAWVRAHRPAAMVVDVSVEVAALVRLMGVPVVLVAQPGQRADAAHELALDLATAVIAPWPQWADPAPALSRAGSKVVRVGGISRFGTDTMVAKAVPTQGAPRAVILTGAEALSPALIDQIVAGLPGYDCTVLGGENWVADPLPLIRAADVVLAHAGQNAIADVAAVNRPLVVLPQPRAFDEQLATATVLADAGLAVWPQDLPGRIDWADAVARARALREPWSRWQTEGAAQRAADVVQQVADGRR